MAKVNIVRVTEAELRQQREDVLKSVGRTRDELGKLAENYQLQGDEWAAWGEVRNIEWLLGETRQP